MPFFGEAAESQIRNISVSLVKKVPNLRFNQDPWFPISIGSLFSPIRNGFVGIATPFYTTADKGVRYLQSTNIHDGHITNDTRVFVTKDFHAAHPKSVLKSDDIVMVQSGHSGECAVVGNEYAGCNCHALIIMSNVGASDSRFISFLLNGPVGRNKTRVLLTGNTVRHILASDMKTVSVNAPSLETQIKIADFLELIDKRIEVQNKIIEEKKREIIVLNDELYSHAIKTIHGFADIADNYSGLSGKNSEDFGKGASYITYLNVLNNRYIDKSSCGYVTIHKNEKQNTVLYGDVILTLSSETPEEVGVSSVYLGNDTLYLNSFCFGIRFKTEETVLPEYATWLFSTTAFRKHIYPFAQGSTRYNLNLGSFMKSSFAFPSVDDQRRFAGLLNRLEESTKLEIKMLDELKLAKSFLLQQLFI